MKIVPTNKRNLRTEAEADLAKNPVKNTVDQSVAAVAAGKLLHELQVHQVELEMQNEELWRAHLALEESRDRYLDLFEFAPVGYLTLTAQGLVAEANLSAALLLGIERNKLLLSPFSRYMTAECADRYHLRMSRLSGQDERQSYDIQIKHENGKLRHVHVIALPVKAEDGTVTLRITLTDITERIQTEQALQESELRWKFAIEGSSDGVWDVNIQTNEARYSKRWKEMLGYADDDILPSHQEWLDRIHPDDLSHVAGVVQAYLEGKTDIYVSEYRLRCKDGSYKWILGRGIAVSRNEDGKPLRMIGTHTDITLQKQAEKVLLDERQRLEKQVEKTVSELTHVKEEVGEVNTALKVMMNLRQAENSDAKNLLVLELKQEVMPFLQRLKNSSRDPKQMRLLSMLDANLQRLISSYGCPTSISLAYKKLTPKEIQVASMVREGLSTKAIAATLSLSPETISIHRKNIRKKLGLGNKADNLRSNLMALDQ